jgi:hypothetical protein
MANYSRSYTFVHISRGANSLCLLQNTSEQGGHGVEECGKIGLKVVASMTYLVSAREGGKIRPKGAKM